MPKRVLCAALAAALTACATPAVKAPPAVVTVDMPVAVPCISKDKIPVRPALLAESAWAASSNEWERQRALRVDRDRLLAYAAALESTLRACVN